MIIELTSRRNFAQTRLISDTEIDRVSLQGVDYFKLGKVEKLLNIPINNSTARSYLAQSGVKPIIFLITNMATQFVSEALARSVLEERARKAIDRRNRRSRLRL